MRYGGADLDTIRQSPRSFGDVKVIEDMADRIQALEELARMQHDAIWGLSRMTFERKPDMRCVGNQLNVRNWKLLAQDATAAFNKVMQ